MHTKILIAAAFAVGAMTTASHAKNNPPETPAVVAANADKAEAGGAFRDLLKQVLRGGKAAPGAQAETKTASLDETATGKTANSPTSRPYHSIISRYAAEYGVPVALAHAVIAVESNYRASARGRAGEIGLMQIKHATARGMGYHGSAKGLYNPETNIRYGMKYLGRAYRLGGGDTCGAILKYNAGHGAKRMNRISSAYCAKVKRILVRR